MEIVCLTKDIIMYISTYVHTSEMGGGDEEFMRLLILLLSWQWMLLCERLELLGDGVTAVITTGCTLITLSFCCLFGEILAGKLSVFVHCARLRTMLYVVMLYVVARLVSIYLSVHRAKPTPAQKSIQNTAHGFIRTKQTSPILNSQYTIICQSHTFSQRRPTTDRLPTYFIIFMPVC